MQVGRVRDKRAVWDWGRGFGCVEVEEYVEMDQLVDSSNEESPIRNSRAAFLESKLQQDRKAGF